MKNEERRMKNEERRDQARLHEELAQREKALRNTRNRNIHEMEELKRAQEMHEFPSNELRESHATIQELTSQVQELKERMNCVNDSGEFQDIESIWSGKLSHVPSQPAIVPSLGGMLGRDPVHLHESIHHRHLTEACFTLGM